MLFLSFLSNVWIAVEKKLCELQQLLLLFHYEAPYPYRIMEGIINKGLQRATRS